MNRNYQHYRAAARRVSRGWTQRRLRDSQGKECLVGAVLGAMGNMDDNARLPRRMAAEICLVLRFLPSFRRLRSQYGKMSDERAIMSWNDISGRRQETVVRVLMVVGFVAQFRYWCNQQRQRAYSWRWAGSGVIIACAEQPTVLQPQSSIVDVWAQPSLQRLDAELDAIWCGQRQDEPVPVG